MSKVSQFQALWKKWRAFILGQGFFIPYRYKPSIRPIAYYDGIAEIFNRNAELARHKMLLANYKADIDQIGMDSVPPEPRWNQDWFPALDAVAYYTMIRLYRPQLIIEIGSGHSTRFALRAISDGKLDTKMMAIDPVPRANLHRAHPALQWHESRVEEADQDIWQKLQSGDFLFIDSSHILMPGTDLDFLLNKILPALPKGVFIHFHDIFLPEDYPKDWRWRGYNEQQVVANLLYNSAWRVLFSSRQAITGEWNDPDTLPKILSMRDHRLASSLWLIKETEKDNR